MEGGDHVHRLQPDVLLDDLLDAPEGHSPVLVVRGVARQGRRGPFPTRRSAPPPRPDLGSWCRAPHAGTRARVRLGPGSSGTRPGATIPIVQLLIIHVVRHFLKTVKYLKNTICKTHKVKKSFISNETGPSCDDAETPTSKKYMPFP